MKAAIARVTPSPPTEFLWLYRVAGCAVVQSLPRREPSSRSARTVSD